MVPHGLDIYKYMEQQKAVTLTDELHRAQRDALHGWDTVGKRNAEIARLRPIARQATDLCLEVSSLKKTIKALRLRAELAEKRAHIESRRRRRCLPTRSGQQVDWHE